MRIAIVGSRKYNDPHMVYPVISQFLKDHTHGNVVIVSGGASGVDSIAADYGKSIGLDCIVFEPLHKVDNLTKYNPRWFYIRNKQIIQNADKVLAIWDGESPGTEHSIKYARSIGVPVMVVTL